MNYKDTKPNVSMEINTNKQPNIPINNPLTMENKYTNIDEFNSLLLIKHEIKSM